MFIYLESCYFLYSIFRVSTMHIPLFIYFVFQSPLKNKIKRYDYSYFKLNTITQKLEIEITDIIEQQEEEEPCEFEYFPLYQKPLIP